MVFLQLRKLQGNLRSRKPTSRSQKNIILIGKMVGGWVITENNVVYFVRHANADDADKEEFSNKFKLAKEAYEILSDIEKRKAYDIGGVKPPPGGWYQDIDQKIFQNVHPRGGIRGRGMIRGGRGGIVRGRVPIIRGGNVNIRAPIIRGNIRPTMRGGTVTRGMRGTPVNMRGGVGGPIRVQQPMRGGIIRGGQRGRGGPIPARGMVRGGVRPPVNIRPGGNVRPLLNVRPGQPRPGFNMRPTNMRPTGPNNGSIRPNMVRPNNGPRPANGVRQNFSAQPRMNNGSVRPNGPSMRGANFNKAGAAAAQPDAEDENSNDSTSQPLPSFGNTWGSQNFNFSNNFEEEN